MASVWIIPQLVGQFGELFWEVGLLLKMKGMELAQSTPVVQLVAHVGAPVVAIQLLQCTQNLSVSWAATNSSNAAPKTLHISVNSPLAPPSSGPTNQDPLHMRPMP